MGEKVKVKIENQATEVNLENLQPNYNCMLNLRDQSVTVEAGHLFPSVLFAFLIILHFSIANQNPY